VNHLARLTLCWIVLTGRAGAQEFRFGLKAGVPLTTYFETGRVEVRGGVLEHSAATRRYTFGPSAEWRFTPRLALELDALYKRIGYVQIENTSVSGVTVNSSFDIKGHSFDFPLLAKYRWEGRVTPYAVFGGALRFMNMGRARGVRTVQTAQSATTTPIDSEESVPLFVPGVAAGAGVEFGAGRIRLLPEVRYTRWRQTSISGALRLSPDQVEFYLGILF
jgi:hypothetical protein